MKILTFHIFKGHERHKIIWDVLTFIVGVPLLNFVDASLLLTSLQKVYS